MNPTLLSIVGIIVMVLIFIRDHHRHGHGDGRYIPPPVGINVYVVYGVARTIPDGIQLESIFRGIFPFMLSVLAGIIIFVIFPDIILFLPNLMY